MDLRANRTNHLSVPDQNVVLSQIQKCALCSFWALWPRHSARDPATKKGHIVVIMLTRVEIHMGNCASHKGPKRCVVPDSEIRIMLILVTLTSTLGSRPYRQGKAHGGDHAVTRGSPCEQLCEQYGIKRLLSHIRKCALCSFWTH